MLLLIITQTYTHNILSALIINIQNNIFTIINSLGEAKVWFKSKEVNNYKYLFRDISQYLFHYYNPDYIITQRAICNHIDITFYQRLKP